jgi:hypothetical protein
LPYPTITAYHRGDPRAQLPGREGATEMRSPVRPRVLFSSILLAASSLLTLVATVLADSHPGPFPK